MVFVYIVRCFDGSLYVGLTNDVAHRVCRHNEGLAAAYTTERRPVTLVYSEPCATLTAAVRRERQIKRWSRAKKEALVAGDLPALRRL